MTAFIAMTAFLMSVRVVARAIFLCDGSYPRKQSDCNPSDDVFGMFVALGMAVWGWWLVFGGKP